MTVWVVEEGDYEQRGVVCVAESPDAAWEWIKARHPSPPYIVAWRKPERLSATEVRLSGDFTRVEGWSTQHTADYDATRYDLLTVTSQTKAQQESSSPNSPDTAHKAGQPPE